MADEENTAEDLPEKSGGKMKMIMLGVGGVVLLATGIFAGPAIMNMISPPEPDETEESAEAEAEIDGPAIYQSLHPPLVVNFKDSFGDAHYMQVTLEVMSRDQEIINSVRDHTPAIRNSLILLFSQAKYEEVVLREGKEKLLDDALEEIQSVLSDRIGKPGVEEVYFTALVIQ